MQAYAAVHELLHGAGGAAVSTADTDGDSADSPPLPPPLRQLPSIQPSNWTGGAAGSGTVTFQPLPWPDLDLLKQLAARTADR